MALTRESINNRRKTSNSATSSTKSPVWTEAAYAVLFVNELNVTQRRFVVCYRRFGKTYWFHLRRSSTP